MYKVEYKINNEDQTKEFDSAMDLSDWLLSFSKRYNISEGDYIVEILDADGVAILDFSQEDE